MTLTSPLVTADGKRATRTTPLQRNLNGLQRRTTAYSEFTTVFVITSSEQPSDHVPNLFHSRLRLQEFV